MKNVTDHFTFEECICPCCDRIKLIPWFYAHMELLERMRQGLGFAIIINSGYRCPEHNKEIGGSLKSWHMLYATDVRPNHGSRFTQQLVALYAMADLLDFGGIGCYDTFIHLDMRPNRWRG